MNIINSIKKLWFGATDKDIETAELGARIDVLMAKHGCAFASEPSDQKFSFRERLDSLSEKNLNLRTSIITMTEKAPSRRILEPDEYLYLNAKSRAKDSLSNGAALSPKKSITSSERVRLDPLIPSIPFVPTDPFYLHMPPIDTDDLGKELGSAFNGMHPSSFDFQGYDDPFRQSE